MVGSDARVQIGGAHYEVDHDLAGEEVLLWWDLFDHDLFVEWSDRRFGPYRPHGGPVPLHRYRRSAKSAREKRAETVAALAEKITIPREAVSRALQRVASAEIIPLPRVIFTDPDPWGKIAYANTLSARRAIADQLHRPLGELGDRDLAFITELVGRTLNKKEIETAVYERFIKHAGRYAVLTSKDNAPVLYRAGLGPGRVF